MSQARVDQSLVRLNESISLLERQMEEGRKAIEQVLHAEITSRYVNIHCIGSTVVCEPQMATKVKFFPFWRVLTPSRL